MIERSFRRIAIICGSGDVAQRCVLSCFAKNELACVVAIKGDCEVNDFPCPFIQISLGKVGEALRFMKSHDATHVLLIGGVKRPSLANLQVDSVGKQWMMKLGFSALLGDDGLLKGLAKLFSQEGFSVLGADDVLCDGSNSSLLKTKVSPDETALFDIKRGFEVAKIIGQADVGQSVIVQQGVVLGVEAKEGTDALIKRCHELRLEGLGGVLIKTSKPNQDMRLDMPVIGIETVKNASIYGLRGIAIECGKVLVSQPKEIVEEANKLGLFLFSINS